MRRKLEVIAMAILGNDCWFFANHNNHLYCKNLDNDEVLDCGAIPWEKDGGEYLFKAIECAKDKVYMIPYNSRSITVYDINKKNYYQIELDKSVIGKAKLYFHACLIKNGCIYAIGVHTRIILKIDINTDKLTYLSGWAEEIEKMMKRPKGVLTRNQVAVEGNLIYCPFYYADGVLVIDTENDIVYHKKFDCGVAGYTGISIIDNNMHLITKGPEIKCVRINSDCSAIVLDSFIVANTTGFQYLCVQDGNPAILMNESLGSKIVLDKVKLIEGRYECIGSKENGNYFINIDNNQVMAFLEDGIHSFSLEVEMTESLYEQMYLEGNCVQENSRIGLKEFIEDLLTYGK